MDMRGGTFYKRGSPHVTPAPPSKTFKQIYKPSQAVIAEKTVSKRFLPIPFFKGFCGGVPGGAFVKAPPRFFSLL